MDDNNSQWVNVGEAAKRLNRSIEQVRRYLREGKLKGRRIGGQWFIEEQDLRTMPMLREAVATYEVRQMSEMKRTEGTLIAADLASRIDAVREKARREAGLIDVVALVRADRDGH